MLDDNELKALKYDANYKIRKIFNNKLLRKIN